MINELLNSFKIIAAEGQSCVSTLLFGEVCDSCNGGATFKIVAEIIKLFSIGIGILGVIGIGIVGIKYIRANGNTAQATKARTRLIQLLIGMASYVGLFWFANFLIPGGIIASTLDSTTTSCPELTSTSIGIRRPLEEDIQLGGGGDGGGSGDLGGGDAGSSRALADGKAVKYTYNGEEYFVANTKNSLDDYIKILEKYKVAQDKQACKIINNSPSCSSSSRDNDTCLSFAYTFVNDLYFGTYTSDWCASQYVRSGWDDIKSDSLQSNLKRAYDEINNGRPVVILVHYVGSKLRHFVAMVGYRASVTSGDTITKDDLLLLNTRNGLTRAGAGTLEVIKDTHSPHQYRIFVLKSSVLGETRKNIITCN